MSTTATACASPAIPAGAHHVDFFVPHHLYYLGIAKSPDADAASPGKPPGVHTVAKIHGLRRAAPADVKLPQPAQGQGLPTRTMATAENTGYCWAIVESVATRAR
jgi:hypothetical protein